MMQTMDQPENKSWAYRDAIHINQDDINNAHTNRISHNQKMVGAMLKCFDTSGILSLISWR